LIRDHLIDKCAHFYQLLSSDSCTEPSNANADQSNAPADNASGNDQKKTEDSVPQIKTVKTMRVAEESIDNFLAYVGELIVTRYKFEHLRREFSNQADREIILYQFKKLNESFTNLSENIERSIMAIRMVPVRSLTQKVPKIIRDIAASTGKDIELNIKGEDLEIDKSLLDTLEGPLIHMIRNAADHGIENSEDRVISQKSPAGKIDLIFTDLEDNIRMEIRDDVKGLDKEKLKDKAVSLGLLDEKQILTDEGIIDLLFMSGVSTAAEVTDVSGRGVGMDVVRQSVNANGGNISVSTKMGKGSVFTVELPKSVTTQIIEGLILDVYGEKYVVPMKSIVDTFRVDPKKIVASGLAGECLQREDSVLTLQRLGELFSKSKINDRKIDGYIITVEDGTEKLGLLADNILGIQQIVVKPIDENILNTEFFIGATQLGDGTVSLVINIEYLCQAPIHTLTSPHQHS
jgi:two-component system chemotaxis sensor kinase CheA